MSTPSELWFLYFPFWVIVFSIGFYKKPKFAFVLLLVLLFFSMYRGDEVGNDTLNYLSDRRMSGRLNGFNYVDTGNFGSNLELGDMLIYYIVDRFRLPFRYIIYAYSLITMIFLFSAFKRLKVNAALGMMFYVMTCLYFFSFSAARQMAAVSIFLFGVSFLFYDDKKKYFFFVAVVAASLFHASAFFFIWAYFLKYLKVNRNTLFLIAVLFCAFAVLFSYDITSFLYNNINIDYITRYQGEYDNTGGRSIIGRIFDLTKYTFFLYMFRMTKTEVKADLYDILYIAAIIFMALFSHASILIGRVTYYLTVFMCVYLAKQSVTYNLPKNSNVYVPFIGYTLICLFELSSWYKGLNSGYYLMF